MIKYVFSSLRRKKSLHIYKNNIIIARKVTAIDERPQCSRIQQQLVCNTFSTFAGIKLWVYGMQRRHWRKRDSVSGNCCQVKKKKEKKFDFSPPAAAAVVAGAVSWPSCSPVVLSQDAATKGWHKRGSSGVTQRPPPEEEVRMLLSREICRHGGETLEKSDGIVKSEPTRVTWRRLDHCFFIYSVFVSHIPRPDLGKLRPEGQKGPTGLSNPVRRTLLRGLVKTDANPPFFMLIRIHCNLLIPLDGSRY